MPKNFPSELFQEVVQYLSLHDQATVARSSTACWHIAIPFIWREVHGVEHVVQLLADDELPLVDDYDIKYIVSPDLVSIKTVPAILSFKFASDSCPGLSQAFEPVQTYFELDSNLAPIPNRPLYLSMA
jgi:hypothetical protein